MYCIECEGGPQVMSIPEKSFESHLEFRTHLPIETRLQLVVRFPGQETNAPLTPNMSEL